MKLFMCLVMMVSLTAWAKPKKKGPKGKFEPSVFQVIPQNSPVKEATAKFLLKTPAGFEIDKVKYKIKNAARIFDKDRPHEPINLVSAPQGNELHISVSKLPPGFYQLYVKVVDKQKKEHDFKTKYKDHAMFTIDESKKVGMPDSKVNNASLEGVDADGDLIRDDIQVWIWENFSSKPNTMNALKQFARAAQLGVLSAATKQVSILATNKSVETKSCLSWIVGVKRMIELTDKIVSLTLNTEARIKNDLVADRQYHGQGTPTSVLNLSRDEEFLLCDFEASKELD